MNWLGTNQLRPWFSLVDVFADGRPKPMPRPRTYTDARGRSRTINPSSVTPWKHILAIAMRPRKTRMPASGAIRIRLDFFFKRPKRLANAREEPLPMPNRMDVDNLAKAVMDVATDIGIYRDDCQVFDLRVSKWYAPSNWPEGVRIVIEELQEETCTHQK